MVNATNISRLLDYCYVITDDDKAMMKFHEFWVEGVFLVFLAIIGLASNIISIVILKK